jgi:hypothetical protein
MEFSSGTRNEMKRALCFAVRKVKLFLTTTPSRELNGILLI